jgi:hypothetical protein
MLRRMSASPAVRAVLVAACAMAVLAGFGLHPEPLETGGVAAHRGLSSAHLDDAPHACPACLTHSAAIVAPAIDPLSAVLDAARAASLLQPAALRRGASLELPGRSPPVRA